MTNASAITARHKSALAASVNAVLAQRDLLDTPRDYITEADAGIVFSMTALLMQVQPVSGIGYSTSSAETAGAEAVEKALSSVTPQTFQRIYEEQTE